VEPEAGVKLLLNISVLYMIRELAALWIIFLHCLLSSTDLSKRSPVSPVHLSLCYPVNVFFVFLFFFDHRPYNTVRYDSVYLTCSKNLTGIQLSPAHGTNKKLNVKLKLKRWALFLSPCSFLLSVAHDHNKKAFFSWLTVAKTVLFQLSSVPNRPIVRPRDS